MVLELDRCGVGKTVMIKTESGPGQILLPVFMLTVTVSLICVLVLLSAKKEGMLSLPFMPNPMDRLLRQVNEVLGDKLPKPYEGIKSLLQTVVSLRGFNFGVG